MANSIRPRVGGTASGSTVYQIAGPRFNNNSRSSSVVNYPLFFVGTVVVAVVIFFIRKKDLEGSTAPGLILTVTPAADANNVDNLTNEITQMAAGSYTPYGSANPNVI